VCGIFTPTGRRFELASEEIERIKKDLVSIIQEEQKILFAYLHGSFGNLPFRDIDIGAYCEIGEGGAFDFEMEMGPRLEIAAGYPATLWISR